jgi:hypothetical protein
MQGSNSIGPDRIFAIQPNVAYSRGVIPPQWKCTVNIMCDYYLLVLYGYSNKTALISRQRIVNDVLGPVTIDSMSKHIAFVKYLASGRPKFSPTSVGV